MCTKYIKQPLKEKGRAVKGRSYCTPCFEFFLFFNKFDFKNFAFCTLSRRKNVVISISAEIGKTTWREPQPK